MEYEVESSQKDYKSQFRAFKHDAGFTGIFKTNLHSESKPHTVIGEECLGVTKCGQLVIITFNGKTLRIEW